MAGKESGGVEMLSGDIVTVRVLASENGMHEIKIPSDTILAACERLEKLAKHPVSTAEGTRLGRLLLQKGECPVWWRPHDIDCVKSVRNFMFDIAPLRRGGEVVEVPQELVVKVVSAVERLSVITPVGKLDEATTVMAALIAPLVRAGE